MSVFTNFFNEPYTFLEVERKTQGTVVINKYEATGVFKLRQGMTEADSLESETSDATLRVKPTEPFASKNMVGQCVQIDRGQGVDEYRVLSQVEGYDYDQRRMDFYLLELKREKVVWEELQSPLV
jgi:hypothetical protein